MSGAPGTSRRGRTGTRRSSQLVLTSAIIARTPQGLAPLAVVLLAQERTGSIAAAGVAGGAWAAGSAVSQPLWGGLAGRGRAYRVEAMTAFGQSVVLLALALSPTSGEGMLVALAALGGLLAAPTSPIARTLWPQLAKDEHDLDRLYTLDATWQELIFIAGPALVGVLVAVAGPPAALITAAISGFGGAVAFALIVRPLWQTHPEPHSRLPLLRALQLVLIPLLSLFVMAFGIGLVDVGVPAVAILDGERAASGWLLAVWSVGSLVGGLLSSRIRWRRSPRARWPRLLAAVTVGTATTIVAWQFGLAPFAVSLFLAGLALAPSLAAGYAVIAEDAPEGRRTDAFAWATTFLLLGIGLGTSIGGVLAAISPTWTFAAGTTVSALSVLAAALSVKEQSR